MKEFVYCFAIICAVIGVSNGDEVDVSGLVSGFWPSSNIYSIVGDVEVPIDESLEIEAGALIQFHGFFEFTIRGELIAVGSSVDSIRFTSAIQPAQPGDWKEMLFWGPQSNGMLDYCVVEYADYGARIIQGASLALNYSRFSFMGHHALYAEYSNPTISSSIFSANLNGNGIQLVASLAGISGCDFEYNNENGILAWHGSHATITNNLVHHNLGRGITCKDGSSPLIELNTIYANESYGISCQLDCSPEIVSNTICYNGYHGIFLSGYCSPSIQSTIVVGNSGNAVYRVDAESSAQVTCSDFHANAYGDWVDFISDLLGVDGNIHADPQFCDPTVEDFHLQSDSPCAPDNNDCEVLMGAWLVGCSTETSSTTWSELKATY